MPDAILSADPDLLVIVRYAAALVLDLPVEALHGHTRLVEDLAADSLALIEIAEVAEERLRARGVAAVVDDTSLAGLRTLDDFVDAFHPTSAGGR